MRHMKRQKVPKIWPVIRKGTTYVMGPGHSPNKAVPLLIVLRDLLGIAQNRKEVKRAIHEKNILINGKAANDENNALQLFDKITLVPSKKNYKVTFSESGKFSVEEVKESDIDHKISKIVGKKILKGKKVQINLNDGNNFLSDINCNVGDSVIVNFKDKKIDKCLPLKDGSNVVIFSGKHAGKRGKIKNVNSERKMATLTTPDGEINVLIKQIMITE